MIAVHIISCAFLLVQLLTLAFAEEKINVTKEAFLITQKNCDIIKDDNSGPPIMFAAADVVVIGKSGAIGKTYGTGNTQYEIAMTPHCILKGNTDQKELTVRNMGKGTCGATDVEKNDLMPYLFFLRATSDPKVYEALNLGAKRIIEPTVVWNPVFPMFCTVTNKKACKGDMCAKACNFEPLPQGGCIPYEQNVIDAIKVEQAKRKAMTTTMPPKQETTTTMAEMKKEESTTTKMAESKVNGTPVPYDVVPGDNKTAAVGAATKTENSNPGGSGVSVTANAFVLVTAFIVTRMI